MNSSIRLSEEDDDDDIIVANEAYAEYLESGKKSRPIEDLWVEENL